MYFVYIWWVVKIANFKLIYIKIFFKSKSSQVKFTQY